MCLLLSFCLQMFAVDASAVDESVIVLLSSNVCC